MNINNIVNMDHVKQKRELRTEERIVRCQFSFFCPVFDTPLEKVSFVVEKQTHLLTH